LKLINDLPDNFLVMNGDVLTDLNYSDFYEFHVGGKHIFTISSFEREQIIDYGVLEPNEQGKLSGFREKPRMRYEVSMGVYMANKRILDIIPKNRPYGFDSLMLDLIAAKSPATVRRHQGCWLDIGRPEDYALAIDEFERMKARFLGE